MPSNYKVGNAECIHCGLRAHSKNVNCRGVFPIFPDDKPLLQGYEYLVSTREVKGVDYFTVREGTSYKSFADFLIDFLKHNEVEDLTVLLCTHEWKQDKNTETVPY